MKIELRLPTVMYVVAVFLLAGAILATGCQQESTATSDVSLVTPAYAASTAPAVDLDPSRGDEIGMVFESFPSPWQEPEEESETPERTPAEFKSTTPSQTRAERAAAGHRGHGKLRFTKDLSRAFVDVQIEGIDVSTINLFHIHCGKPDILGPILVDFSVVTDIQKNFGEDGRFTVEITDEDLVATAEQGEGAIGTMTMGCTTESASLGGLKPTKVSTVAGMAQIALQGELYFNLHTTSQSYFGDLRGQIHEVD